MFVVSNLQSQNVQRLDQMYKTLRFGDINEDEAFGDVILFAIPLCYVEYSIRYSG